jgi:hypothetical protein
MCRQEPMSEVELADGEDANHAQQGPTDFPPRMGKHGSFSSGPERGEKARGEKPANHGYCVPGQQSVVVSEIQRLYLRRRCSPREGPNILITADDLSKETEERRQP